MNTPETPFLSLKNGYSNSRQIWFVRLCLVCILISAPGYTMKASEKATKKGLNLGGLPAVSYNSDEGFQYGAILNLFDYGDGERFPAYVVSLTSATYKKTSCPSTDSTVFRPFTPQTGWPSTAQVTACRCANSG